LRLGTSRLRHNYWVQCIAWSPDGKTIVTGGGDNDARVWDAKSGKEVQCFRGHTWGVISAVFVPGGKRLVTQGDLSIRCWDMESAREIWRYDNPDPDVAPGKLHMMPDGKTL